MTGLVLHWGTNATAGTRIQEQLIEWGSRLGSVGVTTVRAGADAWDEAAEELLRSGGGIPVEALLRRSSRRDSEIILLSSCALDALLQQPVHVEKLRDFARQHTVPCTVVAVVREQLDLVNALYCHRVMRMRTFEGFTSFAKKITSPTHPGLVERFAAIVDTEGVELVAVPFSRLSDAVPARVVLNAAGLSEEELRGLPMAEPAKPPAADPLPGPLLLEATRFMHKRLVQLQLASPQAKGPLLRAAATLRKHAVEHAWDTTEFWGWSDELAAATAERFRAGNAEFARRVWGTPWPDPPPERHAVAVDLAAQPPALVVDVLTAIQQAVDEVRTAVSGLADADEDETAEPTDDTADDAVDAPTDDDGKGA